MRPTGRGTVVATLRAACWAIVLLGTVSAVAPSHAWAQAMDLRQASGVPLPASDLPAGTVSVRVVRGSFANNLSGVDVTFDVDGTKSVVKTDTSGRAQQSGLKAGARVQAWTVVDGERLESQPVTIAGTGIRFVLVAAGAVGADTAAPAAPSVPGAVVLGPESRIVADYADEKLNVFYVLQVVNSGAAAVDIGGPLKIDLPLEARRASLLEGATKQASVSGAHVTVTGPFAPGTTIVNVGFDLPSTSGRVRIEQRFPAAVQQLAVFGLKSGDLDIESKQFSSKRASVQQGQPLVVGLVPAIPAGGLLVLDVTGLPHAPLWPRNVALGASTVLVVLGIWGAVVPRRSRAA